MKKALIISWLALFALLPLKGSEFEKAEEMLRAVSHYYPAIDHVYTGVNPGIGLTPGNDAFAYLGANIMLGGTYYFEACIGAGTDMQDEGGLTMLSVGLGTYDYFFDTEDMYYSLGLSLRNYYASYFETTALMLEATIEQKISGVSFGAGFNVCSQDYEVFSGGYYSESNDRLYHASIVGVLRTNLANVKFYSSANNFTVSLSWSFNLEQNK